MSFHTIAMDIPWPESGGGKIKRGADKHYRLLKPYEARIVIQECPLFLPADDCHLYMWVTNNYMYEGCKIMEFLGFRYITNVPWTKPGRMGIGQYFRGCHEMLLFGVKGKGYNVCTVNPPGHPKAGKRRMDIRSDRLVGVERVKDTRGRVVHSAKPQPAYDLIESRSIGPYLEMFAREHRPGWTVWGDEVP
jgi:N6-adenosine-specific RNA methylase IME4